MSNNCEELKKDNLRTRENGIETSKETDSWPKSTFAHFSTLAIHSGHDPLSMTCRELIPPISLSTTYQQDYPGIHKGYDYSRSGNPTRNATEKCIASIENGKHCLLFSSGLGGLSTFCNLLKMGDHIVSIDDVYGGTSRYFRKVLVNAGIETTFHDMFDPTIVDSVIKPNTRVVWLESPTNPMMKLVDIKAVSQIVKKYNETRTQDKRIIVVVDNTFMSAYYQRPLDLGADICFHSLTKYMNGHSDVVMGCIVVNDEALCQQLRFLQNSVGAVPSPFDCYLVNRGLKTLAVRMQNHMRSGLAIARYLEASSWAVEKVIHPGLASHPQHELAKRQMKGYSGMITFYIRGGLQEAVTFLKSLKIFAMAESLGGYESLAEHPALMTHASIVLEDRLKLGITDNLIRISVGLEDLEDLLDDIKQAFIEALPLACETVSQL